MAGPLDILRSIAGRGTGPQGGAPRTALPAYTDEDARIMSKVTKSIESIQKAVSASEGAWEKMGDARALHVVQKTLKKLKDTQKDFNEVMRDGNADIEMRVVAYKKLAEAQGQHTKQMTASRREMLEARGMAGRLLNVLDDLGRTKGPVILGTLMADLSIVLKDVNEGFDQLARGGQLAGATLGNLAAATARYSYNMRIAMLRAALLGYSAEESNKAFVTLTETYGGTADVAAELEEQWTGLAKLGRISGLGITGVSDMLATSYQRLGESAATTKDNIADMVSFTERSNKVFGKGKVNTREFAQAVQTLAYSQGFYNQNTQFVIETLGREINIQLALGKARKAATESAVKNLQLAGRVNIVAVKEFSQRIQAEYEIAKREGGTALEDFYAMQEEKYGSVGQEMVHLIRSTELRGGAALLTLEALARGSSEMMGSVLEDLRKMAIVGGFSARGAIAGRLGEGELAPALVMINRMGTIVAQMAQVAAGTEGSLQKLFGADVDISDPKVQKFAKKLQETPMSDWKRYEEFQKVLGGAKPPEDVELAPGEKFEKLLTDHDGTGWFLTLSNMAKLVSTFFTNFPFAKTAGFLGAMYLLRPALGAILSRLTGGVLGGMPAAAAAAGGVGRFAARAGGAGLGLYGIGAGIKSLFQAAEMGDMFTEGQRGFGTFLGAWAGNMLNKFGGSFSKEEIKRLALGSYKGRMTAIGDAFYDFYEKWWLDADYAGGFMNALKQVGAGWAYIARELWADMKAAFGFGDEERVNRVREGLFGGGPGATSPEEAAFGPVHESSKNEAAIAGPDNTVSPKRGPTAGVSAKGARSAKAAASLSQGNLILEVSNWEDVLAESQHNMAALAG